MPRFHKDNLAGGSLTANSHGSMRFLHLDWTCGSRSRYPVRSSDLDHCECPKLKLHALAGMIANCKDFLRCHFCRIPPLLGSSIRPILSRSRIRVCFPRSRCSQSYHLISNRPIRIPHSSSALGYSWISYDSFIVPIN